MITINKSVIEEAFLRVLGHLAPGVLNECISEFSSTYAVLGTEEAFKNALSAKAPTVDPGSYDNLFLRFESALKEAQSEHKEKLREEKERREQKQKDAKTDAEKKAAKDEEDALRAEVSSKTADFKTSHNSVRDVNRDIQSAARNIRRNARDSGYGKADGVVGALNALDDIVGEGGEVKTLVADADGIAKDVSEAVRSKDVDTIVASIGAIDAIRVRLDDILANDIEEARDNVGAAITAAEDEKEKADKAAAIKTAVDNSALAVTAAETAAGNVRKGISQYKLDYLAFYGKELVIDDDDDDNVDKLLERADQAVVDAKAANDRVVEAQTREDQTAAETAAEEVVAARDKAQGELTKLHAKVETLDFAQKARDARKNAVKRQKEEVKETGGPVRQFLSSWKGHVAGFVLFFIAIVVGLIVFPLLGQVGLVVAALVALVAYLWSISRDRATSGVIALYLYFAMVLVLLCGLGLFALVGKSDGVNFDLIPDDPTPTATAAPTAPMEPVATIPPDETPEPDD